MILPNPKDAVHRGQLYRLLIEIADDPFLSGQLIFKGGTCATMMGALDRFSVDLDFDLKAEADKKLIRQKLEAIFEKLNLKVKDRKTRTVQYVLKYAAPENFRDTLHFDAVSAVSKSSAFAPVFLTDIQRYLLAQAVETMFAHKLVAVIDRYNRHRSIAGRDIYDMHYFFTHGFDYNRAVIKERTNLSPEEYLKKLEKFIQDRVTETIISQDLNTLLPYYKFSAIRKSLKAEVIAILKDEISRLRWGSCGAG